MVKIDIKDKNEVAYGELILVMDTDKSAGTVAFNIHS
jgi:hypothetical protein